MGGEPAPLICLFFLQWTLSLASVEAPQAQASPNFPRSGSPLLLDPVHSHTPACKYVFLRQLHHFLNKMQKMLKLSQS